MKAEMRTPTSEVPEPDALVFYFGLRTSAFALRTFPPWLNIT